MAYIIDMCVSAAENGLLFIYKMATLDCEICIYTQKEFMYQEKGNQYYDVR